MPVNFAHYCRNLKTKRQQLGNLYLVLCCGISNHNGNKKSPKQSQNCTHLSISCISQKIILHSLKSDVQERIMDKKFATSLIGPNHNRSHHRGIPCDSPHIICGSTP
jgi:hypothetical protein